MTKFGKKPDGERFLRANPPAFESVYVCDGEDDINTVDWIAKVSDQKIPDQIVTGIGIMFLQSYDVVRIGWKHHEVTAVYGPRPLNDWTWQGSTMGTSLRVKAGVHINTYSVTSGAAGAAPGGQENLYGGLIKPNPETNEVEGIDIIIGGVMAFDLIIPRAPGVGTPADMRLASQLVGMVNEAPLMNGLYATGEVLYLGGEYVDGRYVAVTTTHRFVIAPNLAGRVIEGISGVTKEGHQVAWVEYERVTTNGFPTTTPKRIHIERVYERTTLFPSLLGFPP